MAMAIGDLRTRTPTISEALAEARRPVLISQPGAGSATYESGSLTLQTMSVTPGQIVLGVTRERGVRIALSRGPFDLHYGGSGRRGTITGVNVAVIPEDTTYTIEHAHGHSVSVGGISSETAQRSSLSEPVGFTLFNVLRDLHSPEGEEFDALMAPKVGRGWTSAHGGERIDQSMKVAVIGPTNQGLGAGASGSPTVLHTHEHLDKAYVTFGGMRLVYVGEYGLRVTLRLDPGEIVVVPAGVPHYAEISDKGPTFVIAASTHPILGDNFHLC